MLPLLSPYGTCKIACNTWCWSSAVVGLTESEREIIMAEGTEIEERVDLDEDNYMEEMDDDVEEQLVEDGSDDIDDDPEEEHDDSRVANYTEKEEFPEVDRNDFVTVKSENEEKRASCVDENEKEKHAKLLALPPHGSEVFVGGLSRDVLEEDLRDRCETMGEIHDVRLVKNKDTGESKGYAFISFMTKEAAQMAIDELHNKEVKGRTIRCSLSESKHRLFIGNLPKSLMEDEFIKTIKETGPGTENIELIKDPQNPSRNRGFAFVEYYNHACADYSRQKMASTNFKLDGHTPSVTWADPKSSPDPSAAAQVKALYVKNIPDNTTTEQLKEVFQRYGEVTKVVTPPSKSGGKSDFGFIHFADRSSALKAVKDTEKHEIDGHVLEVALAKPQSDKKFDGSSHGAGSYSAYAYLGNPYGSVGSGYSAGHGFQQPMIYGRGPMPAGMQMVSMVLPDGRIGYVLQQPGMQMRPAPRARRSDRGDGRGGSGGDRNRSGRYRPY